MVSGIHFGPIAANAVHLCVDMQRLFAEDTAWRTPWMARVLPVVVRLCERKAERTCFTRFIPARSPREGEGAWTGKSKTAYFLSLIPNQKFF
jgi:nicotinamidase-related amidase